MRIAAVQHDIAFEDRKATLAHLEPLLGRAVAAGPDLVLLTEMFPTGFSMRTHLTAESEDGPTLAWLQAQAQAHDTLIAGSLALLPEGGGPDTLPTNALVVMGPAGILARYDKIHPFSYAGEHERFRAGDDPISIDVAGARVGVSVCYDLRFADLYWDRAPAVDVEVVVANWPAARRHHWRALLDARAIENQCFVVGVNRVGSGGGLDYAGDSRIIDPLGEVVASAAAQETVLTAELDPGVVAEVREHFPFRADRRARPRV